MNEPTISDRWAECDDDIPDCVDIERRFQATLPNPPPRPEMTDEQARAIAEALWNGWL